MMFLHGIFRLLLVLLERSEAPSVVEKNTRTKCIWFPSVVRPVVLSEGFAGYLGL